MEDPRPTADRALIAHAAVMTILGLLSGFTTVAAKAPRAALSAHTIGVLQGALLFGLAAVWPSLGRSRVVTAARWCALVGLYANWLGFKEEKYFEAPAEAQQVPKVNFGAPGATGAPK